MRHRPDRSSRQTDRPVAPAGLPRGVVNGTMVATSEAAGGGFALGAVVASRGAAIAVPWAATAATDDGSALVTVGSAVLVQQPQSRLQESPVEEAIHPARHPRQVRVPSSSSVAPSDTSSVDAATDDAAIGMVSSTGDDYRCSVRNHAERQP